MKRGSLKTVSPDGQYAITYGSGSHIIVTRPMPPRKAGQDWAAGNIVGYIPHRFFYGVHFKLRRSY